MSKIPGSPMERINIQIDAESNARIAVEAQSEADGSPYDSVTGLVNEIASETIHGLHQSTLWYQRASYDDRESGRSGKALAFAMPCRFSG